jgi:putative toxin-antitoxin system antitoxin component (TIGR02293 family)
MSYDDPSMMIEPARVAEILGIGKWHGRPIHSLAELSEAVNQGLPKTALPNTALRVFHTDAARRRSFVQRVVPQATFKRRKNRLSPAESQRTERLARVIAMAEFVWDDAELARRFLLAPHPELGGSTPLDTAFSELGARRVEDILAKILYGLPV